MEDIATLAQEVARAVTPLLAPVASEAGKDTYAGLKRVGGRLLARLRRQRQTAEQVEAVVGSLAAGEPLSEAAQSFARDLAPVLSDDPELRDDLEAIWLEDNRSTFNNQFHGAVGVVAQQTSGKIESNMQIGDR